MGRWSQQHRRGTGGQGAPPLTVIGVNILGDHSAQWIFSAPVTVIDPGALAGLRVMGTEDPITGILGAPESIECDYSLIGPVLVDGGPWDIYAQPVGMAQVVAVPQSGELSI